MAVAASTNSRFLTSSTAPRICRVICGQANRPRASTTTVTATQNPRSGSRLLTTEMTTMAASRSGIDRKMSLRREMIVSSQPP